MKQPTTINKKLINDLSWHADWQQHEKSCPCLLQQSLPSYKGRSINKLQNSIILLVFQILKILNIGFAENLILCSSCEFYYDDITMMSFITIKYITFSLRFSCNE